MQELCQMLTHKLRLISNKIEYKSMTKTEKDELLDTLLVQKKKQALRILVQTRLQQAMATRHINADEEINQVKTRSFAIMKIYLPELSLNQEENSLGSMVKLFINFFNMVSCSHRSQEIKTIYEKRLCPKALIAATLFNWLVEWVRKQFQQFLKVNIHSLYVNSRQSTSVQNQKQVEDDTKNKDSLDKIGLLLQHFPSKLMIHRRQVKKRQNKAQIQIPRSLQHLRIMSQNNLRELHRQNTTEDQSLPINRQVFLFAFAEELQNMYKSIEDCVPDLESGWARRLKRGGRREEALRRANVVADSCIKQMPLIKQSIDEYRQFYLKSFAQKQKLKQKEDHKRKKEVENLKTTAEKKKKKKKKASQREEQSKANLKDSKEDQNFVQRTQNMILTRNISTTQQLFNDKKQNSTSRIVRNNRYSVEDNSESNLLMTTQKQSRHKKRQISFEISHKTLDLAFEKEKQDSTYLMLNQRGSLHQLEIIQERVKKMKARVLHGRHTKHSMSQNKEKTSKEHYRSIEIDRSFEKPFRSVDQSLNKSEKMYLKLPKVKGIK